MAIVLYKWLLLMSFFPGSQVNINPVKKPSLAHPFYVSVTEINHNSNEKTLEISCKVFSEDFENTLKRFTNGPVDIYNPKDTLQLDKWIADYFRKHLQIKLDGKVALLEYVGHEREDQSTWSYFQVSNVSAPRMIEISNNIFYEVFDKQINIMHVSVGGNRKSSKLDFPATEAKFEF